MLNDNLSWMDLRGVLGSKPVPSLLSLPHVHFLYLPNSPRPIPGLPFVLTAPRKVIHQVFSILNALLLRIPHPPEFIVVQVRIISLTIANENALADVG